MCATTRDYLIAHCNLYGVVRVINGKGLSLIGNCSYSLAGSLMFWGLCLHVGFSRSVRPLLGVTCFSSLARFFRVLQGLYGGLRLSIGICKGV